MEKEQSLFIVLNNFYHQSRDLLKEHDYQSLKHVFQEAYPAILKDKTGEHFAIAEALTIVLSQFIVELLGSKEDLEEFRECFANEVALYEALLKHEETINGYVNLSIALSHSALFNYKKADYELSASCEKKRLKYLRIALEKSYAGEKSYRYDIESIESSIYKSVCGLISSSEQMEMDDRMSNLHACFAHLYYVLSQNKNAAIDIYSLENAIAEELFRYSEGYNPDMAMHYILSKIYNLESLIEICGVEEAIIEDMTHTYQLCSDFVEANLNTINNKGRLVWSKLLEIISKKR